jgi:multidrug efflux pump subunit AcrA (membrane-fusion protein)
VIERLSRCLCLLAALSLGACSRDRGADQTASADREGPAADGTDQTTDATTGTSRPTRVTLSPEAVAAAHIRIAPVTVERGELEHEGLDVPGHVELDPRRVALASPRASGRLERLEVVEGDHVRAGQTVALVASPEYLTAQGDFVQATRRAVLLAATPDAAGAAAIAAAARRRLARLGVGAEELERLAVGGEPRDLLAVPAPLDGTVMKAHVLAGAAVEAGTPLFEIADLSIMDVIAQVPERSLPLLRVGRAASVSVVAFPGLHVDGTVERLRGGLDPETRTAQAVVHVRNAGSRLRPGMFATVRLQVPADYRPDGAAKEPVLLIPADAVVNDGDDRIVFVEVRERTYERREVRVEPHAAGALGAEPAPQLQVRDGLRPGEKVVVQGAFVLKSELGKAVFGEAED